MFAEKIEENKHKDEVLKERRRWLHGQLVVWGYVVAYRESGGIGYPASLSGGNGGNQSNFGMPDIGTAYCNIERALEYTAPIVRGMLWHQYAKPFIGDGPKQERKKLADVTDDPAKAVAMIEEMGAEQVETMRVNSLEDFIITCYGNIIPEHVKALVRVCGSIRRDWVRKACEKLCN